VRVLSEPRKTHNRVEKGRIVALWILNGEGMQSRSWLNVIAWRCMAACPRSSDGDRFVSRRAASILHSDS